MRILVVDDDEDFRELLKLILTMEGHQVELGADGLDAQRQLAAGPAPAMIFLDMMMPRMDGEAFLKAIRSNPRLADIPVVILSGHKDAQQKAAELGAVGCLVKPIEFDDLHRTVQAIASAPKL